MNGSKPVRRKQRGASLIEFALCALVFFMLYFGIMDWAWTFFQHQTITWRVSDAARWAAANRADDQTAIQNIVMCGNPAGCAGATTPFYTVGNIAIQHFSRSDQIDPTGTFPAVDRYYIRVTVQNYQVRHFIPGFSGTYSGAPISSIQPMECQQASGNCWDWN
jgi:Flp pilus assembly protein TadG